MVSVISVPDAVQKKKAIFIDTRTPAEFQEDHLPQAVNLPILSNEERAIVGTMYKQESPETALRKGVEFFSQRMPEYLNKVSKYKDKEIIVYCWRGGMRSRTIAALLDSLGYNVQQLEGGYKKYREYVRERLQTYQLKPTLMVLWGLTCTGKTELLSHFSNALDLEGLAQHRGSLYGAIGLQPHSQKRFENLLLQRLEQLQHEKFILIEGESRKIGDVQIPEFLHKAMKQGIPIQVRRSMEVRSAEAVKNYFGTAENVAMIKKITQSLFKVISNKSKQEVIKFLDQGDYTNAAWILLEQYYDPLYQHTLEKISFAAEINNDDITMAVKELGKMMEKLVESKK